MRTIIYRAKHVEGDKVGNNFTITAENLDSELTYDEVYIISSVTHEWVSAKSLSDIDNGIYEKIKNNSFRGLLSNIALYTPPSKQPETYFIEKEHDYV